MTQTKINYPILPENFGKLWDDLVNYKENWAYSHDKLERLNSGLNKVFDSDNFTIAIAGSYGRMEASGESDLDYMIFFNKGEIPKVGEIQNIRKKLYGVLTELGIELPNVDGVFSEALSVEEIVSNIGDKNDNLNRLAQRMLLLMESRAVYNEDLYKKIVEEILREYLKLVIYDPGKEALFLLNDLIRYFRGIAVNYQFNFWRENQKWVIRNVKLRHSRILIYAGLLLLIMNASKIRSDKFEYFKNHIYLTPIEKIVSVYTDNQDYTYERLLRAYDIFLGKMNHKEIRKALQVDYEDRYKNPHYAELKVTSDFFISELTRFIFCQREVWTQQIFEYLIF